MKKLLISTTNPGKFEEIKKFLSDLPLKLVGFKDLGIIDTVEETGKTFEENAVLKAKFYAAKSGLPTLADDGGFEIDALGGEPGVKSHRWIHGDREDSDEELIAYAIKRLEGVPLPRRGAQLRVVIALAAPGGEVKTAQGVVRGIIPLKPSMHRVHGYPYRSLLYIPTLVKFYFNEFLTSDEILAYNHRRRALEELKRYIVSDLK